MKTMIRFVLYLYATHCTNQHFSMKKSVPIGEISKFSHLLANASKKLPTFSSNIFVHISKNKVSHFASTQAYSCSVVRAKPET